MTASAWPVPGDPWKHAKGAGDGGPTTMAGPLDLDELCERFSSVCESAVDALEISSALEFDGLTDQAARRLYGLPHVFALAREMYLRVPRRPAEPAAQPDPWRSDALRPALHGLLYGLPAVCYPAAAGLLAGPHVVRTLIVALLASWSLSQALAYLGYRRLGQAGPGQSAMLMQAGMAAGLAGVAVALAIGRLFMHANPSASVFGLGLGAYMLGATVLLVLGADQLLLIGLAPGVLGAATFLILGRPASLTHAAWAAMAVTPLLVAGLATRRARREVRLGGTGRLIVASELWGMLPSAGFGLVAAGLLAFPAAAGLPGHHAANTGAVLASLPLALSMGAAEWLLVWFRRRTQRLLRQTRSVTAFAVQARLALLAALAQYLLVSAALIAIAVTVAGAARLVQPLWEVLPASGAYLALGGAMFLALLLQAFGSRVLPLAACAAALAFEVLWRGLGVPGQVASSAALLGVLAGYSVLQMGSAVRHAL